MRIDNCRVGYTVTNPGGELFKGTRKLSLSYARANPVLAKAGQYWTTATELFGPSRDEYGWYPARTAKRLGSRQRDPPDSLTQTRN